MMLSPMSGLIASSPARFPNSWTHPIGMGDWAACDRILAEMPWAGLLAFDGGVPCALRAVHNAVVTPEPVLAPPGLPSGAHGEVVLPPPGSGGGMTLPTNPGDAQAVVDEIANQQLEDQKKLNAAAIAAGGHWYWDAEAGAAKVGDAVAPAFSTGTLLLLGAGAIAALILSKR